MPDVTEVNGRYTVFQGDNNQLISAEVDEDDVVFISDSDSTDIAADIRVIAIPKSSFDAFVKAYQERE